MCSQNRPRFYTEIFGSQRKFMNFLSRNPLCFASVNSVDRRTVLVTRLLGCAGGFRARVLQVWQFVLSPTGVPDGYVFAR